MKFVENNVIRCGGGFPLFRIKKMFQIMAIVIPIVFLTLVFYQNVYGYKELEVSGLNKVLNY